MRCKTCSIDKPSEGFYVSNKTRCKECVKDAVNKNRLANIDRIRAYDRSRASMPHRMANNFSHSQEWRKEYPNRARAQSRVAHALASGKLEKHPCFICGSDKVVGHHPDYDRPLDVVWLCQPHHKQAHALIS